MLLSQLQCGVVISTITSLQKGSMVHIIFSGLSSFLSKKFYWLVTKLPIGRESGSVWISVCRAIDCQSVQGLPFFGPMMPQIHGYPHCYDEADAHTYTG